MISVKKISILLILILTILFFIIVFSKKNPTSTKIFYDYQWIKTGDILLWANTSLDSLSVQELTDGIYSHSALLHKDSQNQVWVLDTYPEQGLRYLRLEEYLSPKEFKLVRIGLIRFKEKINVRCMESLITKLVENKSHILFDPDLIFDADQLQFDHLDQSTHRIYCSELIYKLLKECTETQTQLYENDYERVIMKWKTLSSRPKHKAQSALDFIKLYYLKLNLKKLKDDHIKVLITPNGLLRSGSYRIVKEVEISKDLTDIKRLLRISEERENR